MNRKLTVFVMLGHYLPGYKSGGPLRSIVNLIDHLHEEFDFRILTTDRDLGDRKSYPGIKSNAWNTFGAVQVYYASPDHLTLSKVASLIRETPHDILYLNSFFSLKFSILPLLARRLGLIPRRPVVLAPRGEFSEGALALKYGKKRAYLIFAKASRLVSGVTWQASSSYEADDISREFGNNIGAIRIATNLPRRITEHKAQTSRCDDEGFLRIVFLSRISPKKNLRYAVDVLSRVTVPVKFNIYGPLEDEAYWHQCQRAIASVPENIDITYRGAVTPEDVAEIMRAHDLFFFPTRGENYGHVIAEALAVGTPVLISDTTPWRDLEGKGIGCELPLSEFDGFVQYIENLSRSTEQDKAVWRKKIKTSVSEMQQKNTDVEDNRLLFISAVSKVEVQK